MVNTLNSFAFQAAGSLCANDGGRLSFLLNILARDPEVVPFYEFAAALVGRSG